MLPPMLAKKLLIRLGSRVAVVGAPPTIDLVLPPGVHPSERGPADIVLLYARHRARLAPALAKTMKRVVDGGTLWVAYPRAGQLGTDLNRDILASALRAKGLEPVSQIAIDDVWSALRVNRAAARATPRKARGTARTKAAASKPKAKAATRKPKAKAATRKPKAAASKPTAKTATRKSKAATRKPKAATRKPKAATRKPKAATRKSKA